MRTIAVTMDVEPDFGGRFGKKWEAVDEQMPLLLDLFDEYGIKTTLFVEAETLKLPIIKEAMKKGHEIASHGFGHEKITEKNVISQIALVNDAFKEFGHKPKGFRSPYLMPFENLSFHLKGLGVEYDSSWVQAYFPGRYNYLHKPNKVHRWNGLKEIPVSRIPMSFSAFSLLQSSIRLPGKMWWKNTEDAVCYFHCHDLKQWPKDVLKKLPWYMQIMYRNASKHHKTLRKIIEQFSSREFNRMEELI